MVTEYHITLTLALNPEGKKRFRCTKMQINDSWKKKVAAGQGNLEWGSRPDELPPGSLGRADFEHRKHEDRVEKFINALRSPQPANKLRILRTPSVRPGLLNWTEVGVEMSLLPPSNLSTPCVPSFITIKSTQAGIEHRTKRKLTSPK